MKKNITILSLASFLLLSAPIYFIIQFLYQNRLNESLNSSEKISMSLVDIIAPEIKTAFLKPDDISLLYSIERVSKIQNIAETFIVDKDLNIVIHNDSSKWNKKYTDEIYKRAALSKTKLIQKFSNGHNILYSLPINETYALCTVFSFQNIADNFKVWRIKLYVSGFLLSLFLALTVYYMSNFLFLKPFNKAKKYLSLKETSKKTIYSDLVSMAASDNAGVSGRINEVERQNQNLKELINCVLRSYLRRSDDIFIVLDNGAKIIYCLDENQTLINNRQVNTHIVAAAANSELIKNVSEIIDNPDSVLNMDIGNYKINIVPVKNDSGALLGVIISGNFREDTL